MNNEKVDITPELTLGELFVTYPETEEALIKLVPVFIQLQNPVTRSAIARVTTVKQASVVGGIQLGVLVNELKVVADILEPSGEKSSLPTWIIESNIKTTYDAGEDIVNGVHPVNKVLQEVSTLGNGEIYILITPFVPTPLIEKIKEKGFDTLTENASPNQFKTYICKLNG